LRQRTQYDVTTATHDGESPLPLSIGGLHNQAPRTSALGVNKSRLKPTQLPETTGKGSGRETIG
jgi:hypothetical protein